MKVLTTNQLKNCLIVLLIIVLVPILYSLLPKIYFKLFPKEENLNIKEWSTYTQYLGEEPFFTIKHPKGWQVKTTGSGGGGPHTEIRSPWNSKNNKDQNYIYIDIFWNRGVYWGGIDPLFGSPERPYKLFNNGEDFTESKVDGYRTLFAKKGINGYYENNIYILTNKPLFKEDKSALENNTVFRFEMTYNTKQNPEEIKAIYHQIVNSFNLIE